MRRGAKMSRPVRSRVVPRRSASYVRCRTESALAGAQDACSRSASWSIWAAFRIGMLHMKTSWIKSSTALPRAGQPIEFVVDNREVAIAGTYAGQIFQSRWTSYDLERVGAWRLAASSSCR